jgi:hypothetical protein
MDSILATMFIFLVAIVLVVFLAPIAMALGALGGMICAYFFPSIFDWIQLHSGLVPYQIGALFAYLGLFIRSTNYGK